MLGRFRECMWDLIFFFFFQAEDGIRDYKVTGVQTCALPILIQGGNLEAAALIAFLGIVDPLGDRDAPSIFFVPVQKTAAFIEIGRASCRERV